MSEFERVREIAENHDLKVLTAFTTALDKPEDYTIWSYHDLTEENPKIHRLYEGSWVENLDSIIRLRPCGLALFECEIKGTIFKKKVRKTKPAIYLDHNGVKLLNPIFSNVAKELERFWNKQS